MSRGRFFRLLTHNCWFVCAFMARKLRVEHPGAVYHVINCGDRREPIFKSDEDRRLFLVCLNQCCTKKDWWELERRVEAQRAAEENDDYKTIRRGWCLRGRGVQGGIALANG